MDYMKITTSRRKDLENPEINELRRQRNEYSDKATEIQKLIDEKVMNLYEVPDIVNKYIYYSQDNHEYLMKVRSTFRLFSGVRITGTTISRTILKNYSAVDICSEEDVSIGWSDLENIKILTKEKFDELKDEFINYIKV